MVKCYYYTDLDTIEEINCKKDLPQFDINGNYKDQSNVYANIMKENMKAIPNNVEYVYFDFDYQSICNYPWGDYSELRSKGVSKKEIDLCKKSDAIFNELNAAFKKKGLKLYAAHDWSGVLNPKFKKNL